MTVWLLCRTEVTGPRQSFTVAEFRHGWFKTREDAEAYHKSLDDKVFRFGMPCDGNNFVTSMKADYDEYFTD